MTTINLQPSYILHTRVYRDTSLLVEAFSQDQGRVSLVARGVRSVRSRTKGLFQPFIPLLVSWYGKSELMSLSTVEQNGVAYGLVGDALLCGIYLNELLMRLLHRYDAHPNLFLAYQDALKGLQNNSNPHMTLRLFERRLLSELGYALQLDREAVTGNLIDPEQHYYFDPSQGLLPCLELDRTRSRYRAFHGKHLLALHEGELEHDEMFLRESKYLLRIAINHLLDGKILRSRELFL